MDNRLRYLNGIRYFEAAARLRSYSRAAQELFVSQAAVSQQIRQLEAQLDCKFFVRKGNEMHLSEQGDVFYRHVSLGLKHVVDGFNAIDSEPLNGVLNVSTSPSFAARWLMPRLWKFTLESPNIAIRVHSTSDALATLGDDIDIAVGEIDLPDNHSDHYHYQLLFEEPVFPVCSPALVQGMNIQSPEDLLNCWLVQNDHHFNWEEWFDKANVTKPRKSIKWLEVSTLDMGLSAVIAGHGVCPGTQSLVQDLIDKKWLVKPFDIELTPGISNAAMYHLQSKRLSRIKRFIHWLTQEATS